jgi:hypothetical protein
MTAIQLAVRYSSTVGSMTPRRGTVYGYTSLIRTASSRSLNPAVVLHRERTR